MLNFALIGCGRIGEKHAELIKSFGSLKAVCDIDSVKADAFALKFSARAYYNIEDLLQAEKDLSVVVVCTPNGLHAAHSVSALQTGCHVICEKPMALSVADCQEMMDAAEKNKKLLVIVKQNRFNPPVTALKQVLDEGRLGRIVEIQVNCFWNRKADYYKDNWRGTLDLDGGTLFTQFSHFIDLMHWLAGDVKKVQAITADQLHQGVIEFEDCGSVNIIFESGALGSLHYTVNSFGRNLEGSVTVFGEKGTVKVGGEYLNKLEYHNIDNFEMEPVPEGNPANDYGEYKGSMSNHYKVYENLLAVLEGREDIMTGARDGLKTVDIIERIYASAIKL